LDTCGNPVGPPHTIPLELDELPASTRDGRLRATITSLLRLAKESGCRSLLVEDLNFADARQTGRATLGRGRRGKRFRRTVSGIPTRRFRDLLVGMATNHGLWVIAVDPGWTSVWGRRCWQTPLNQATKKSVTVSGHHAAAVVIGRRGLGLGPGDGQVCPATTGGSWRESYRPGRATSALVVRDPGLREASGQRQRRARPARLNGTGSATRWSRTVRGHRGRTHSCSLHRNGSPATSGRPPSGSSCSPSRARSPAPRAASS
jgi:hypothetical protein